MNRRCNQCVFSVHSVKGHVVAANLLLKTAGPQIVNVSDAKGRWVKVEVFGFFF